VVEAFLGVDRKRRRFLVVERTKTLPTTADPAQCDVTGDQLDDIGRFAYLPDVVVSNSHGLNLTG